MTMQILGCCAVHARPLERATSVTSTSAEVRPHRAGHLVALCTEQRTPPEELPPVPHRVGTVSSQSEPLVSCIMLTANRRRFVPLAVRCFLQQEYPSRELVIIDDGDEPIGDLLPEDSGIRYLRLEDNRSIGAKRNLACEVALGKFIVHWNDGDWSAPWRLGYQLSAMRHRRNAVCGLTRVLYHQPSSGSSWQYVYADNHRPWLASNTLCYAREFWSQRPFLDLDVDEDARFLWSTPSQRLLSLEDNSFFVAMVHAIPMDPNRGQRRFWIPHPTEAIQALMGSAFDYYRACLDA